MFQAISTLRFMRIRSCRMAILAGIVMLGAAAPARADLEIILQEDSGPKTYYSIATGSGTGSLTAPSPLVFGDFTLTGLAASQSNGSKVSDLESTDLTITNNTNAAHTLTIQTYANDFTLPAGSPLNLSSSAGGNNIIGSSATTNMTHQGWINNANTGIDAPPGPGVPGLTPPMETSPGSQAPTYNGMSFDNGTLTTLFTRSGTFFSLTSQASVNVGGGEEIHFTETLTVTATPAPAAIVLALTGLPVLGGVCWRRRRSAPKLAA
jgi:hypothetical protein